METTIVSNTNTNASAALQAAGGSKYPQLIKSSAGYLANAIREGIKQNFLGYDIDIEFISLSVRSFAQTSGTTVKNIIAKYKTAGNKLADKRFQINNKTTFSHS